MMFTNGSKYFVGVAGFSAIVLVLYMIVVDGAVGGAVAITSVLLAAGLLAGFSFFNRDGDVKVGDEAAPANAAPINSSLWPLVSTLGIIAMGVGLITHEIVFILGLVALAAGFVEWVIQGWAESASSDAHFNNEVRGRIIHGLEFPVIAVLGAAVLVLAFSRIMLSVSKTTGAILFIVVGSVVLVGGVLFAVRPNIKRSLAVGMCTVGTVVLVAGGITGASAGKRDQLVKAKEENHFAHKECGEEESEHFDFNSEGTVSARSNPIATVEFVDGKLRAREVGIDGYVDTVTIPKMNPVSVIFRNKTEGDHRLTLQYGEHEVQDGVVEELVTCTQMIKNGEEQILTLTLSKSSIGAKKPYEFYVPGVEGQSIEVFVP